MIFHRTLAIASAALAVGLLAAVSRAHDGQNDAWIMSLDRPDVGGKCCDQKDGKITDARLTPDGWLALTPAGTWIPVPPEKIVRGKGNPTGRPVLFWLPSIGITCFVEPPLS